MKRIDGLNVLDHILEKYSCGFDMESGHDMLHELHIAQTYGMKIEEYDYVMLNAPNWDMAKMYVHNIFCECKMGWHYDNFVWNVGWVGSLHIEKEKLTGKRFAEANR